MGLVTVFVFQRNDNIKIIFHSKENQMVVPLFLPPIQRLIVKLFSQLWETKTMLTFLQEKLSYI